MNDTIHSFLGDYSLLNPAYLTECIYDGDTYPSIIAAVEASKFPKERRGPFRFGVARAANIGFSKPYTDKQLEVLRALLEERFKPGTPYYDCLMQTGDADLVYGNNVHRNWYGACTCSQCQYIQHKNYVGEILESIRAGQ